LSLAYSSCPLDCFDGCRFKVDVSNGRVQSIQADPEHQVTRGFICANGRRHLTRLYSKERLTQPLLKTQQGFQTLTLDNALNVLADNLTSVVRDYGSKAILNYTGSGSAGILHNLGNRFFNTLGGSTETIGSLCWGSGIAAQNQDFGPLKAHDWADLTNSQ